MQVTTPTLFLSGAGLPAWIWYGVAERLDGESRVAARPSGDADLAAYVDAALGTADGWDRFHLVAHSAGGVVGSALLAEAPERVSGFLAVAALVPDEGQSFLGALPFPQRTILSVVMRALGTRPPAKEIREGLCRGIPAELADRIVTEFEPESQRLYRDPVPPRAYPAHSAYLLTEDDTQFTPALQEQYAARLGGAVRRIPTAHLPMIEAPDAVAGAVATLGQPS